MYRAGFVGLIGQPNSGKSTLFNLLVGEKVSIVTSKPQTTRRRVIGMVNRDDMQAVLVDAPGLIRASKGFNLFLREEALDVANECDVLLAVLGIDEEKSEKLDEIVALARESGKPWIAVIHKTDLPFPHRPRILREKLEILGVPVIEGSSVVEEAEFKNRVLEKIRELVPAAPGPLYDRELYTLSSVRELCGEIVREKCFEQLHQEVPFGLAVRVVRFLEDEGPVVRIEAEVLVAKDNHKPIVIGRGGQVLKSIGTEARKEIVKLVGRKVFLDLKVRARDWQRNPAALKELGYVHIQA